MIYDTLENFQNYFQPDSPLFRALSFAARFDPSRSDGRYEIEANDIFALVSSYETVPASQKRFEIHHEHADVQIVLEGEEKLEVSSSSGLKEVGDYDEIKDMALVETVGDPASLLMGPGRFAVLYPKEAHRPGCDVEGKSHVRKIVVKVRMTGNERI
ncbi:MAG: YhcH/YjgK/YiaL family protein [Syntrophobacteraceae bacterium]